MIVKIENLSYAYEGRNILAISGTVSLYADDGVTLLHQRGISARTNLADSGIDSASGEPNWKARALRELQGQAQDVIDAYKAIMQNILEGFHGAQTPEEVLAQLSAEIESGIIV